MERRLVAIIAWGVIIPLGLSLIPGPMLFKIGLWITLIGTSFPFFTVLVPEVTGLIALNFFTGELHPFGPGLQFKYPWDIVRDENFIPLEIVTKDHKEDYAAKDGPMMKVKWSYQYVPNAGRLDRFIAVDESTIDRGFTDVISSILSEVIGGRLSEEAREKVEEIQREVLRRLEAMVAKANGQTVGMQEKLERQYGVNFKLLAIADIDFSEDYQQARSGQARMAVIVKTAKMIDERGGKPTKDAMNTVLVEQGKAKKNIFEVEGLPQAARSVADAISRTFKGRS